jgi:hypothetical protein
MGGGTAHMRVMRLSRLDAQPELQMPQFVIGVLARMGYKDRFTESCNDLIQTH